MLKEFVSKPQVRLACVIEEKGKIEDLGKGVWKYSHKAKGCTSTVLEFTKGAKQVDPVAGDFIVHLSKTDIYLLDKETFEQSYKPKGGMIG